MLIYNHPLYPFGRAPDLEVEVILTVSNRQSFSPATWHATLTPTHVVPRQPMLNAISWSPIRLDCVDCIVQDVKDTPSISSSSVPAPKRLPRLPVLSGLCLFASPLALDFLQLLIPLLLDFRRGAAQADKELRALELFRQPHARPQLGVFGSELPDLGDLGGREVVFLLLPRAQHGADRTGVVWLLCPRSIARSRWRCGAGSRGDHAPSGVVLGQELLRCVVDIGRARGRVEDDVILGFGGRGRERGIWLDAESFSCAAEGRGVAAAGEAHPL